MTMAHAKQFERGDRVEQPIRRGDAIVSWKRGTVVKTAARGIRVKLDDDKGTIWLSGNGIRKIEPEPEHVEVTVVPREEGPYREPSYPVIRERAERVLDAILETEVEKAHERQARREVQVSETQDPSVHELMAEAVALAEMQAPLVRRLQAKLMALRERAVEIEREREEYLRAIDDQLHGIEQDTARIEATLDGFAIANVEAEIARPYDQERIRRYQERLDMVLHDGPMSWREIRVAVLQRWPDTDTSFLYSALNCGKDGLFDHDGKRNGAWSIRG